MLESRAFVNYFRITISQLFDLKVCEQDESVIGGKSVVIRGAFVVIWGELVCSNQ